jgi:hypothetical protein
VADITEIGCERMDWIHLVQIGANSEHGNERSNWLKIKNFLAN